jgi:hypothetical protein
MLHQRGARPRRSKASKHAANGREYKVLSYWPCWTTAEWVAARALAAHELGLPTKGPRGSWQNRIRRHLGTRVAARARMILWLDRAKRISEGKEGK